MNMFSRDTVERISRFKAEPAWMTDLRLVAWEAYERLSEKAPRDVPLESIQAFTEPPTRAVPSHQWPPDLVHVMEERGDEEGLIIQRDSTVLSRAITKEQVKRGVIFTDLDTALKTVPDLVRHTFAKQVRPRDRLAALHLAFWSGGTFLYVPANVEVKLPFHTCYWMSTPGTAIFPHTLIVAEKSSRVSFIDEFLSVHWEEPGLSIRAVEVFVREGAQVHLTQVQNWGRNVFHRDVQESQVDEAGRLRASHISGRRPVVSLERVAELYPEVRL